MNNTEKVDVISSSSVGASSNSVERLDYPGISTTDGAYGVAESAGVSGWLSSINMAATFDRSLIRKVGRGLGYEFRNKGYGSAGPNMNLYITPLAGRSKEQYGADPYLAGEMAYEIFSGAQDEGAMAVGKHLIANDWETNRLEVSREMGERTLHEVYLKPFARAVQGGMTGIMCAMNALNGSWTCSNSALINGELKTRLGFQGYITPDVSGQRSVIVAGENGLDQGSWDGLEEYVANGTFPQDRLDDMAVRVVGAYYSAGLDTNPVPDTSDATYTNVQRNHSKLIREAGAASIVVLKNEDNTLPLNKPTGIAVIGNNAAAPNRGPNGFDSGSFLSSNFSVNGHFAGQGEGCPTFPWLVTPLDALSRRIQEDNTALTWAINDTDFAWQQSEAQGATPYGSVAASSTTVSATFSAQVGPIDVCIVTANVVAGEGFDRDTWSLTDESENSIWITASNCNKTIVVLNTVGSVNVEAWADHPNVTAIVWAGLPGQNSGDSLVDVLYGDVNPSARLPFTWGKNLSDYPYQIDSTVDTINYDQNFTGLLIDYRYFDYNDTAPRWSFGHGLSYTSFEYGDVTVEKSSSSSSSSSSKSKRAMPQATGMALKRRADSDNSTSSSADASSTATDSSSSTATSTSSASTSTVTRVIPEGQTDLRDTAYTVSYTIENTGSSYGCEVSQLYLGFTTTTYGTQPKRVLRGFERTCLEAGATSTVSHTLVNEDVRVWSVWEDKWVEPDGDINYFIGASSRDLRVNGTLSS